MFKIQNTKIQMTEGDFGIVLPISIVLENDETITSQDTFAIKIYKDTNKNRIISKEYTVDENGDINFELTQEETAKLPIGEYKYDLDWYDSNNFLVNLIGDEVFSVIEKAGKPNES